MLDTLQKEKCCGCYACVAACPRHCITMVRDDEGFEYPQRDDTICISCGICEKVCPVTIDKPNFVYGDTVAFGAVNRDEAVRKGSSSGGAFSLIAEYVIGCGGVVFGATFDENFEVVHDYVDSIDNLCRLRGSKYVQSRIGDTYTQAKAFLDEGKTVLFTGTPCQIAGLKSALRCEYDNLICQDVACHGVPSPLVWKKHVECRQRKARSPLTKMAFRCKESGWQSYSVKFEFNNGKTYKVRAFKDAYMKAFGENLSLRPSCYACEFKSNNYFSDITLADFWGVQHVAPEMHDDRGTSLVVVRTEKGRALFEKLKDKLLFSQVNIEEALRYNGAMLKSANEPTKRETFFDNLNNISFDFAVKNCCKKSSIAKRIINRIKRIFK